jgi:hypothetical protein
MTTPWGWDQVRRLFRGVGSGKGLSDGGWPWVPGTWALCQMEFKPLAFVIQVVHHSAIGWGL